jgi:hypothetical protein
MREETPMSRHIARMFAAVVLVAAGLAVGNATRPAETDTSTGLPRSVTQVGIGTAYGTDPYSQALLNSQNDITDSLNAIGWPTADAGNHNFYPGALGHPDNGTSATWGTPGSPTTYHGETKCAAFLTQSLKHAYSWATSTYFTNNFASASPTAAKYYDRLSAGTAEHFDSITRVQDLLAGDIIAIKYTNSGGGSGDPTGHVMTVTSIQTSNRDANAATTEYAIRVIDSTSNPHGVVSSNPASPYRNFPDTRATMSNVTEYSGIGRGWVFIQVDAAGAPAGYWWGPNENVTSQFQSVAVRPITLARPTEAP